MRKPSDRPLARTTVPKISMALVPVGRSTFALEFGTQRAPSESEIRPLEDRVAELVQSVKKLQAGQERGEENLALLFAQLVVMPKPQVVHPRLEPSDSEDWQQTRRQLLGHLDAVKENIDDYTDAVGHYLTLRKSVGVVRHKLREQDNRNRYFAFGLLHDVLLFTDVTELSPPMLNELASAIEIATADAIEGNSLRRIRKSLLSAGFSVSRRSPHA